MSENLPPLRPAFLQELGDELLVYLPHGSQCHLLNPTLAQVYRHCQQGATWHEITRSLEPEVVEHALQLLAQQRLLAEVRSGPSRRDFLKKVGQAAAAVPIITSVVLPSTAAAASVCFMEVDFGDCPGTGDPPTTCANCCDDGAGVCATPCPTCTNCFCMTERMCAGGDCTTGTCSDDANTGFRGCIEDGTSGFSGCVAMAGFNFCRRSCDDARDDAGNSGVSTYYCCEGTCT